MSTKKYILAAAIIAINCLASYAQQNPAALNPLMSKTPLTGIGDEFDFSFVVGNNGTIVITGADDFNRMRFDLTLGKSKPKVLGASTISTIGTDAVSGTVFNFFDITYNEGTNTFTGIQKLNVPINLLVMSTFSVHAEVVSLSSNPSAAQVGGSVDVTPNVTAQANNQSEVDDDIAFFTYTLSVLPVTGMNLKAIIDGSNAKLEWETLTESNTAYFQVEKSEDGLAFAAIGKVTAVGNSNSLNSYSFTDALFSKTAYYRIKLYDKDGDISVSNIEALSKTMLKGIGLFPNPAKDFVTVTGLKEKQVILFCDYKGAMLQQVSATNSTKYIGIKGYAAGTYLIQVLEDGKVISTKKFIKN